MELLEFDGLPQGLLERNASELNGLLPGPALIHLRGRRTPALFLSVLMHGNETTGWEAIRSLLGDYMQEGELGELPRAVTLFIGNVVAAARGVRRLDGQPDYNRVWPGCDTAGTPEHQLMEQVVQIMTRRGLFASVDIHNNTGHNPHYACLNVIDNRFLHLATLFSRTVVYFIKPCGVQSLAMSRICPSVTLECGRPGQQYGVEHAREYLNACLHLAQIPEHPVASHDVDLFHTVAIVKVPEELDFGFDREEVDLSFPGDLDRLNFRELHRGTLMGHVRTGEGLGLEIYDEDGREVAERYLQRQGDELRLRLPVMPSMLSCDERVIRQDCFCYLMERYNDHL